MTNQSEKHKFPTVKILGSRIHNISISDTLCEMERWIEFPALEPKLHQIIVTGFHGIWEAHQSEAIKNILNSADIWIPDGIAPVMISRLMGFSNMKRIPGAELMQAFFEIANRKGYRSFFYGDTEKTLDGIKKKLSINYPNHKIVGTLSPPFRTLTREEDADIIRKINHAQPDVLWVALGLPKQERWIFERRNELKVPIAIGVGAAFSFISEDVKRVPEWIGKNGLEWLWRFIQEPQKLWRRDLIDGPRFLWHVFLEQLAWRAKEKIAKK